MDTARFVLAADVVAFEERFADYCNVKHCVALNSGTSALHLALLAAEAGPGDEVITVSMTFVATTAAIHYWWPTTPSDQHLVKHADSYHSSIARTQP
jgi:dTDP-4-amino-4,6-dideoxygalactose transaminase